MYGRSSLRRKVSVSSIGPVRLAWVQMNVSDTPTTSTTGGKTSGSRVMISTTGRTLRYFRCSSSWVGIISSRVSRIVTTARVNEIAQRRGDRDLAARLLGEDLAVRREGDAAVGVVLDGEDERRHQRPEEVDRADDQHHDPGDADLLARLRRVLGRRGLGQELGRGGAAVSGGGHQASHFDVRRCSSW